jgi:mono/diheme cytochrome c family protein
MPYGYSTDDDLDQSTNRVMMWGAVLMLAMAAVFPLYRWFEPNARDESRALVLSSLEEEGEALWSLNCSSCHGLNGEGAVGPALNSQQFLQNATNQQIELLVSVGVPGSQMGAYSLDHGGPLTTEQIKALALFIRSWESDAPDNPDWRAMVGG